MGAYALEQQKAAPYQVKTFQVANGGKFDIIRASYYPFWTNKTVGQIVAWAEEEGPRFNRKILPMETGYDWNPSLPDGTPGQLVDGGRYQRIYPEAPRASSISCMNCLPASKASPP